MKKYGTARQATDNNVIGHMRTTWWIKATDTHSEYVILNAFPRQQWLRERASMYIYTYTARPFCFKTTRAAVQECIRIGLYVTLY